MASGVPVVAPKAGGILSYATDENIRLTEPKGETFAAAICETIENPGQTAARVEKAMQTARSKHPGEKIQTRPALLATYDKNV